MDDASAVIRMDTKNRYIKIQCYDGTELEGPYTYEGEYSDSYYLEDAITYTEDIEISNTYVGDDTQITYLLTDIYNQEYWTPAVPKS